MKSTSTLELPEPAVPTTKWGGSGQFQKLVGGTNDAAAVWMARFAIFGVALSLFWYTWGHWGDFQADCGREVYVPAAILQGKLLYRDIWYMYGPLAPYLKASLFRLFGIHMNVLYGLGLSLAIGLALTTFEIGRRLKLGVIASLVTPLFFLAEAFHPFIFNFPFPYSYAADLGSFLGLACLYFVLRHCSGRQARDLVCAALLASLTLLTKQEIGCACLALLAFEISAIYFLNRSKSGLLKNAGLASISLVPPAAVYGWFVWKTSAKALFFENWIQTPGSYFMRTFAKKTMADQGFRLDPHELIWFAEFLVLSLLLWWALARIEAALLERFRIRSPRFIVLLLVCTFIPIAMVLHESWAAKVFLVPATRIFGQRTFFIETLASLRGFLTSIILPKGIYECGIVFLARAIYKLWQKRPYGLEEGALAVYALCVALREMAGVFQQVALYFNVPLVLIFVIVLMKVVKWATRALDATRRDFLISGLVAAEGLCLFLMYMPNPSPQPAPVTTSVGTIYTESDIAEIAPVAISFMQTHTKNHNDILVLPEMEILYAFAGMQCPSRWYSLIPGYVAPYQEPQYIQEIEAADVRYILLSNSDVHPYGIEPFGVGYNQEIYRWMMANYVKIGQLGPLNPSPKAFAVSIFAKKEHSSTP